MPDYLLSGVTPTGRQVTERVEADSADLAVKTLRERGYEQIRLHTDTPMARYASHPRRSTVLSPREHVDLMYLSQLGLFFLLVRKIYAHTSNWLWCLALPLGLLFYRRYLDRPWDVADILILVVLAAPWLVALKSVLFGRARRLRRLINAQSWHEWDKVLRLLPLVRSSLAPFRYALYEATALAGLGRHAEAVRLIESFADDKTIPEWRYRAGLADVFWAAGRREEALEAMEKAFASAPDEPMVCADLAVALLRCHREPERAAELLRKARSHALSDLAEAIIERIEGALALERGNPHDAEHLLAQSLRKLSALRVVAVLPVKDMIHADLAICHAQLGDRARALKHFRRAERRLRATGEEELLHRCQEVLGITD